MVGVRSLEEESRLTWKVEGKKLKLALWQTTCWAEEGRVSTAGCEWRENLPPLLRLTRSPLSVSAPRVLLSRGSRQRCRCLSVNITEPYECTTCNIVKWSVSVIVVPCTSVSQFCESVLILKDLSCRRWRCRSTAGSWLSASLPPDSSQPPQLQVRQKSSLYRSDIADD